MNAPIVSMVRRADSTETRESSADKVIRAICCGKWRRQVETIRAEFRHVLRETGDRTTAKLAVAASKKQLPAVLWSGRFSHRAGEALIQHSGLLCADLDALGDGLPDVRARLAASPHLWAVFVSPTGDGLKTVFRFVRLRKPLWHLPFSMCCQMQSHCGGFHGAPDVDARWANTVR